MNIVIITRYTFEMNSKVETTDRITFTVELKPGSRVNISVENMRRDTEVQQSESNANDVSIRLDETRNISVRSGEHSVVKVVTTDTSVVIDKETAQDNGTHIVPYDEDSYRKAANENAESEAEAAKRKRIDEQLRRAFCGSSDEEEEVEETRGDDTSRTVLPTNTPMDEHESVDDGDIPDELVAEKAKQCERMDCSDSGLSALVRIWDCTYWGSILQIDRYHDKDDGLDPNEVHVQESTTPSGQRYAYILGIVRSGKAEFKIRNALNFRYLLVMSLDACREGRSCRLDGRVHFKTDKKYRRSDCYKYFELKEYQAVCNPIDWTENLFGEWNESNASRLKKIVDGQIVKYKRETRNKLSSH